MVDARGERAADALAAVEQSYGKNVADEFVLPTVIGAFAGIKDGDGIMMANFRADRAREILLALLDPAFDGFARTRIVKLGRGARHGRVLGPAQPLHDGDLQAGRAQRT